MRKIVHILVACVLVAAMLSFSVPVLADDPEDDGSTPYPGYTGDPYTRDPTQLITQEYFGNEWVNTIPSGVTNGDDELIMSPWEHHGYIAGSNAQLTPYDGEEGTYAYFAQLAEKSPRATMWNIGKTQMDRDMYIFAVSEAETIENLDTYLDNIRLLADPRLLGFPENEEAADAAAAALIADRSKLKPIAWLMSGCHSSETGGGETMMEMGYRLTVDESPVFKNIRKNEIVFITDSNPDGQDMVADWVNRYMQDPEWKDVEPRPPYYNLYSQHDNNRDFFVNSAPERVNLILANQEYPAQYSLDLHESIFMIFTCFGREPSHPAVDPITQTEWQWFATREMNQMEQFGHPGAWTYKYGDTYLPFYISMLNWTRSCSRFYETWGHTYPTTITRDVPYRFYSIEEKEGLQHWFWFNPMPYTKPKVVWSLRNNCNYAQTCLITTCQTIARNRETILQNYWVKGKNALTGAGVVKIGASGPFAYAQAYVVPVGQKDMVDTVRMINNFLENGIEIHTANSEFTMGGTTYPAGSFIIPLNQPYSALVYALLAIQYWPENCPQPYDASAWQFDLMRDVDCDGIDDPAVNDVPMTLITADQIVFTGTVSAEIPGGAYVIDHNSINNIVTLVFGLDGYDMFFAEDSSGVIDVGDIIIPDQTGVYTALTDLVPDLGLTMHSVSEVAVAKHEINVPRVAIFHSWDSRAIRESGWTRWTFEDYDIPYTVIQRTDVLAGNLSDNFDVIILPDRSASRLKRGISAGTAPEEVWYGPVQTTQRTGGLGDAGIAEFKQFVDDGGRLICNDDSSDLPIEYDFVEWVSLLKAFSSENFFNAAGPIVKFEPEADNPVCYGADEEELMYQDQSPVFVAPEEWIVASYPDDPEEIMVSGKLVGAEYLAGKGAFVVAPAKDGTGSVVLFGTDITFRGQAQGVYTFLWNAILNWDVPIPEGTPPPLPPTGTVGLTVDIPEEWIVAISAQPTDIDFGTLFPGEASDPVAITVENIGERAVDVGALIDPAGTVFENLTLDDDAYGSWEIDLAIGASDVFDAVLEVPPTYTPKGEEEATLIFEATSP